MPGYEFHVVALVATAAEPAVWALPDNVVSLVKMPLWGPAPVAAPGQRGGGRRAGLFLAGQLKKFMQYGNPEPMWSQAARVAGHDKRHPGGEPGRPRGADGSRRGVSSGQNPFFSVSCGW
jgi:hypothetical protein